MGPGARVVQAARLRGIAGDSRLNIGRLQARCLGLRHIQWAASTDDGMSKPSWMPADAGEI